MTIKIIKEKISKEELEEIAKHGLETLVKAVVDIEKEIIALGGEFHADANSLLIEKGSRQKNLWGINIYFDRPGDKRIEFSSLINIRPSFGNRSMEIEDPEIKAKIKKIIDKLITD